MAQNRISLAAARGNFLTWCVSGYMPTAELCKPLYFAQKLDSATNSEVGNFYVVYSMQQARDLFGAGSIAATMAYQHFCTCPSLPLYIAPLDDPDPGAKAAFTMTISGPATDNGVLSIAVNDEVFAIGIIVGTTADQIAAALASVLQRWVDLPFDVTVAGAVVTFTARNAGSAGNTFVPQLNPNFGDALPAGVGLDVEQTTVGVGVIDIDPALPVMACRWDCIALGAEDEVAVNTLVMAIRQNWACGVQGDFKAGHLFHSKTASSGTIYAYGMSRNNPEECVMPVPVGFKYAGYMFAAAAASRVCCTGCDDPSRPVQYDNGYLGCMYSSALCHYIWTSDEKKMFFDAGIVNWDLTNTRGVLNTQLTIEEPLTTYKYDPATGAPDGAWQRVESRYTVAKFVRDLGNWYKRNYSSVSLVNDGVSIPQGKRAVSPKIMQASIMAWFVGTELGWTADLAPFPLEQIITVERTNSPNFCDPNRLNVMIDLDLVNVLARIATTIDSSPEFACIPPSVTAANLPTA